MADVVNNVLENIGEADITYLVNYSIDELLILLYITLDIPDILSNIDSDRKYVDFVLIYYENKENIKINKFYNSLYNILNNNINLYILVNYIFNNIINNCYKLLLSNIEKFNKYINEYLKPILEIIKVTNNNNLRLIISFENYLHLLILSNYSNDLFKILDIKDNINLKIRDLVSLIYLYSLNNEILKGIKILESKLSTLTSDNDLKIKYKFIKNTNIDSSKIILYVSKIGDKNVLKILLYNYDDIESYDKSLIDSNKPTIVSVIPIKEEYNEFLTIFKTKPVCITYYNKLKLLNKTGLQTIDDIINLDNIDKNVGFCNPWNACYRNAVFTFIKYIPYIIKQLKDVKEITDFLTYPDYNNTVKFYNLLFQLAAEDDTLFRMLTTTSQEDIKEFLQKILDIFIKKYNISINKLEHKTSIDKLNNLYYNINYTLFINKLNNELDFSKIVFDYEVDIKNELVFDVINNTFNDYIILSIQVSNNSLIGDIKFINYDEITINDNKYILNSFICRIGDTTTNGHYYNMVKKDKSNKWYKIDDSNNTQEILHDLTEHIKYVYVLYYKKSDTPSNIFNHEYNSHITNILQNFSVGDNFNIDTDQYYIKIHDNNVQKFIKNKIEEYNNDIKYSKLYNYIKSYCEILLYDKYNNNIIIEDLNQYISDYYSSYNNILYNITINDIYFEFIIQNINKIFTNLQLNININAAIIVNINNIYKNNINVIYNDLILSIAASIKDTDTIKIIKNIILYHFIYLLKLLYIPEIDNINIISGNYIQNHNLIEQEITNKYIDILCIFNDNIYYKDAYDTVNYPHSYNNTYYNLLTYCNNNNNTSVNNNIYTNKFSNWILKNDIKQYDNYDKNAILFTLYNIYDNTKIIKILAHDFFGNNATDNSIIENNIIDRSNKIVDIKLHILKQVINVDNPDIIIGSFNSDYEYYINKNKEIHQTTINLYNIDTYNQSTIDRYKEINDCQFEFLESNDYISLCDK